MTDDKLQLYSDEAQKNAQKGRWTVVQGAGIGALIGWAFAGLFKTNTAVQVAEGTIFGAFGGYLGKLTNERRDNRASASKLDTKMITLDQENKFLKHAVTELGGTLPDFSANHAEKVTSERAEDCGCTLKR